MAELSVRNLVKEYRIRGTGVRRTVMRAVDDVSFDISAGRTVALVGESGSGKSTIARAIMRLMPRTSGEILLDGVDIDDRALRGRRYRAGVQMVFQDPFSSLNPTMDIRHHLLRPLRIHGIVTDKADAEREMIALLDQVNLHPATTILDKLPHELSGGQRQRVAIARALAPRPSILVADEPVSMLDVSIRLEILDLLDSLKQQRNLGVLYITHDLATARHYSENVMVMRKGRIVEAGPTAEVIDDPAHPYTQILVAAAPDPRTPAPPIDVDRHLDMPDLVRVDPKRDPLPSGTSDVHWVRTWDGDRDVARLIRKAMAAA